MRSTFFGLTIGYSGLAAQQRALDITGHNVANANTEGYTRQQVIMEAGPPVKVLQGYVGTGVEITEFRRIRDQFLDIQMRTEYKNLGEWETKFDILDKLQVIFNEPSESSLRSVMDAFWEKWQLVSKNPESVAVRASVMQSGISLADTFNHMARQFYDLQVDLNDGIALKVDEINSIARQIRDLNVQIIKAEADGSKANDLRDRRDLLVEQLSKIVEVTVSEDDLGAISVGLGGRNIVSREVLTEIVFAENQLDPTKSKIRWVDPLTGNPIADVNVRGGQLQGYFDMRDNIIPRLQQEVSELARRIATEVNILHRQGYDSYGNAGQDFFVKIDDGKPFGAGNIQVNPAIVNDTGLIAAAAADTALSGDGDNALLIAQLRNKVTMNTGQYQPVMSIWGKGLTEPVIIADGANNINITINGVTQTISLTTGSYALNDLAAELENQINTAFGAGTVTVTVNTDRLAITCTSAGDYVGIYDVSGPAAETIGIVPEYKATFDDFFRATVAQLGVAAMEAERMVENQTLLVDQLINKREAISGVSLDEEMTNLIRYQHAYTASARVINAMDEMIELIVNRLGIIGR